MQMHTKFQLHSTHGSGDKKQREIWPLTFICIAKMAPYQLGVNMYSIGLSDCICIQNLGSIGPVVSEIQNKGDLTFDLHLHSEDDVMSTWFYYVI